MKTTNALSKVQSLEKKIKDLEHEAKEIQHLRKDYQLAKWFRKSLVRVEFD